MNIAAVYQSVTQSIIAELERGAAPWIKPWKAGKRVGIMPANAITRHHYRGINVPIVWHAADAHDAGGHVKKGEKRTHIVFTTHQRYRLWRGASDFELSRLHLFNVAQLDGIEALLVTPEPPPSGSSGRIRFGDRRGYRPRLLCPLSGFHSSVEPERLHVTGAL